MKLTFFLPTLIILALTSCSTSTKNSNDQVVANGATANATEQNSTTASAAVPTMTVNDADWEVQDLSTVAPLVPITMKVPKNAKIEKNGNGGADIRVNDFYLITVSALADGSFDEAKKDMKELYVNNTTSYQNGKIINEEPGGFIYSIQMKDEANGTKYQAETHFTFYTEKDGAIYQVADARPIDNFSVAGSAYSEDIAKKVYAIVKASAKVK